MKNTEISKKVHETINRKIKSGEISYKCGEEHHLYKGNNIIRDVCKSRLYNIRIFPILQRDGFKCTKCGSSAQLQVHHTRPFRDILREAMEEMNISYNDRFKPIKDWDSNTKEALAQNVLDKHKLEDGITLCKKCHEEIDYYYRPYKGEHKNEN